MLVSPAQSVTDSLGSDNFKSREALPKLVTAATSTIWSLFIDSSILPCHAFDGKDANAELHVHRLLYALYARQLAVPWDPHWQPKSEQDERLKRGLEGLWDASERRRLRRRLEHLPSVEEFPKWATATCQSDRSNVQHPLFAFLRDQATFAQLREFLIQETPFDIYFGDLIALMLPGFAGGAKAELASNLWDEMGCGNKARMHRQLRIDMMEFLSIPADVHIHDLNRFCVDELRLANGYLHAVSERALLPQAIGMLLATELMVPGRLDHQIQGWRRVGLVDEQMEYLILHTTIDPIHAYGWMENVALPLLREHPQLMPELALGMMRRLDYATAVCDRMLVLLPEVR